MYYSLAVIDLFTVMIVMCIHALGGNAFLGCRMSLVRPLHVCLLQRPSLIITPHDRKFGTWFLFCTKNYTCRSREHVAVLPIHNELLNPRSSRYQSKDPPVRWKSLSAMINAHISLSDRHGSVQGRYIEDTFRGSHANCNTEVVTYNLYMADDAGRVTTWDLKPVLLSLVHTWDCASSNVDLSLVYSVVQIFKYSIRNSNIKQEDDVCAPRREPTLIGSIFLSTQNQHSNVHKNKGSLAVIMKWIITISNHKLEGVSH